MPLKNSKENGMITKYPNKTPVIKDENPKNTTGKTNFFSFEKSPGEIKHHI